MKWLLKLYLLNKIEFILIDELHSVLLKRVIDRIRHKFKGLRARK